MDFYNLLKEIKLYKNIEEAYAMSKYMRNKFKFIGVRKPILNNIFKDKFKKSKFKDISIEFIDLCWQCEYRELQYICINYLKKLNYILTPKHIDKLKELIITKSWWDTIDGLDRIVGNIALRYPELNSLILDWSISSNLWLRRVAIDHQLSRKEQTNAKLLEEIIINNFNQKDFFINKAIGWSLREYSKTDPLWVKGFIYKYQKNLSSLSIREGSKYL